MWDWGGLITEDETNHSASSSGRNTQQTLWWWPKREGEGIKLSMGSISRTFGEGFGRDLMSRWVVNAEFLLNRSGVNHGNFISVGRIGDHCREGLPGPTYGLRWATWGNRAWQMWRLHLYSKHIGGVWTCVVNWMVSIQRSKNANDQFSEESMQSPPFNVCSQGQDLHCGETASLMATYLSIQPTRLFSFMNCCHYGFASVLGQGHSSFPCWAQ